MRLWFMMLILLLMLVVGFGRNIWQSYHDATVSLTNIGDHIDIVAQTGNLEPDEVLLPNLEPLSGLYADPLSNAALYIQRYEQSEDISLVPSIVAQLIKGRQYEQAIPYLTLLDKKGFLNTTLPIETIMLGLLNGITLNFKNIETLKNLIQKYSDQGILSKDQTALYSALITFTRGDYNNYSYFMDQLSPQYSGWKQSLEDIKKQFYSYPDVATSYLDALIAMEILKQGYPNVAITNARTIVDKDSSYMLPRQIVAYGAVFLGQRDLAQQHLDILIDKDSLNKDIYLFFKGVALFHQEKYQEAIISFSQVTDEKFHKDIVQYMFLMFVKLQDTSKIQESVKNLVKYPLQYQDYLGIFYPLLREQPFTTGTIIPTALQQSLAILLRKCYQELPAEQSFTCLYGKAGVMMLQGDDDRVYDALRQVIVYYPQDYLYTILADIATKKGNILAAKKYILRAGATKPHEERTELQLKLMETVR